MPRRWSETIDTHRRDVNEAIQDTASRLVAERGLTSVSMAEIAEQTGIGRATLYRYYPDVDAILVAWHERRIARHLEELAEVRDLAGDDPGARLEAVLGAYAHMSQVISHRHRATDLAAQLHRGQHVGRAQARFHAFLRDLLAAAAKSGRVRRDIPPAELATFCVNALRGAREMRSRAEVHRLVVATLGGLRPPR